MDAAYCRKYYSLNKQRLIDNSWRHRLKKRYGLTEEQYAVLLAVQVGCCAICGKKPDGRRLDVDHDHKTGAVRGLLCRLCNRAIGYFQDDPSVARRAADYLTRQGPCGRLPGEPNLVSKGD